MIEPIARALSDLHQLPPRPVDGGGVRTRTVGKPSPDW